MSVTMVHQGLLAFPANLASSPGDDLERLEAINLSKNSITEIPKSISKFSHLRELILTHNQIVEIPVELGLLQRLEMLNLSHNHLLTLPLELASIPTLIEIEVNNNFIASVPKELAKARALKWLTLDQNPHGILHEDLLRSFHMNLISGMDDIHEIIPGLFLGGVSAEIRRVGLDERGITHILSADSTTPSHPEHFKYLQVELADTDKGDLYPVLPSALNFLHKALESKGKVYVHCNCGISRSGSVVIAYLMKYYRLSFPDAFVKARATRPCVRPNTTFQKQLRAIEESKFLDTF